MSANKIGSSYTKSLLWVALFAGIDLAVSNISSLIFVDFIHGNPHQSGSAALVMMVFFTPMMFLVAFLGALIVFGPIQIMQAGLLNVIEKLSTRERDYLIIAILPVTTIFTWYCYDYLTPTDCNLAINVDPDWTPYQHGLTLQRYLWTLAFQAPVTIFSYLYLKYKSRRPLIFGLILLSVIFGFIHGYACAIEQYKFIEDTRLHARGSASSLVAHQLG